MSNKPEQKIIRILNNLQTNILCYQESGSNMKEVLSLHVGQCGIQVANDYWPQICREHNISPEGVCDQTSQNVHPQQNIGCVFNQLSSGKLVPRTVMIDSEPTVIDEVKKGKYKKLYNSNDMIFGKESAANIYSRVNTAGKQTSMQALDQIRRIVQKCDNLDSILVTHSVGGGTGSGMTSYIMSQLSHQYPKKKKISLFVYPSQKYSDTVVQNYNTVLSLYQILQNCDLCIPFTNQRLYEMSQRYFGIQNPTFENINHLISQTCSNITSGMRIPGETILTFNDLVINLIPYPRINLAYSSYNEFNNLKEHYYDRLAVDRVTKEAFNFNNFSTDMTAVIKRFISACLLYRTKNPLHYDALNAIKEIRNSDNVKFVDWTPHGMKIGHSSSQLPIMSCEGYINSPISLNILSNNINTSALLGRVNHKFDLSFGRRAFVHWYSMEGLEQLEFSQGREGLAIVERDYQECHYEPYDLEDYNQVQ